MAPRTHVEPGEPPTQCARIHPTSPEKPARYDEGYGAIGKEPGITHVGCWAHARRKFDEAIPQVPPQSLTGNALAYFDGQWPKLIRVLDDGRLPLDRNGLENTNRLLRQYFPKGTDLSACSQADLNRTALQLNQPP
jgi:hypothetical protein